MAAVVPLRLNPISSRLREDLDMARRRGQRRGYLRPENGSWLLTYRVYTREHPKGHRITVTIGPAIGPGKLTRKQAERFAYDHYLKSLDNAVIRPLSTLTIAQFWEDKYKPHLVKTKKYATQIQYISLWTKWIEPTCGRIRMFEAAPDHVDQTLAAALEAGKSTSTVKHIRKVFSAVFTYARRMQCFSGDNPAQAVECPQDVPVKRIRPLTPARCTELLAALPEPARTMALMAITMSLNVSELLGLDEEHVNFSNEIQLLGTDDSVPPHWISVRTHLYHGRRGSLKTGKRRRDLPMPQAVEDALRALIASNTKRGPEMPVFQNTKGKAQSSDNLRKRVLERAVQNLTTAAREKDAKADPFPPVTWHILRHTHATLSKSIGMSDYDRQRLMGHASVTMTDRYTHEDRLRMEAGVERITDLATGKTPAKRAVVNIAEARG